MAIKNDNLIDLAKTAKKPAAKKTARKPAAKKTARKPAAKKTVAKKLTPEELRDQKAKETVENLLKDSPITTLEKKDDLLELDEPTKEEPKGVEWLEEQVTLLNQKNEALTAELDVVKIENQTLKAGGGSDDGELSKIVIQLFNELQENHIKMGVDNRGIGNFRIYCPGFLNRLIKFFPFLEQHKRY